MIPDDLEVTDFPAYYWMNFARRDPDYSTLVKFFARRRVDEVWASQWASEVIKSILRAKKHEGAALTPRQFSEDLDQQLARHQVGPYTASRAFFLLDMLEVISTGGASASMAFMVLEAMLNGIGMSDESFRNIPNRRISKPILDRAPTDMLNMLKRHPRELLRGIYTRVRDPKRIKALHQACTREASSYQDWLRALVRLDTALLERMLVPIEEIPDGEVPHLYVRVRPEPEGSFTRLLNSRVWHPWAKRILTSEEMEQARREEAVFEEQSAHLVTAMSLGCFTTSYLRNLNSTVLASPGSSETRMRTRKDLMRMRSHYQAPPYLVAELEAQLRHP